MAMTNAGLSDAIKAQVIIQLGAPTDASQLQKFCDAIATAVVTYVKANAVVTATGVDPQGGSVSSTGTVS